MIQYILFCETYMFVTSEKKIGGRGCLGGYLWFDKDRNFTVTFEG